METKKYRQFGTVSVIILLPLLIVFLVLSIYLGLTDKPYSFSYIPIVIVLFFCLLTFYQLTITIDDKYLSFKLGIGWIGKRYAIEEISSCKAVKNNLFNGYGIRLIANGWLYNVSGLDAIELHFKNKKSIIRIGTNKVYEVTELVQSLLEASEHESEYTEVTTTI